MIKPLTFFISVFAFLLSPTISFTMITNPIVDTGQSYCFDNQNRMKCQGENSSFYGQDAHYIINPPAYRDNGDGTITDLVTGLMWSKDVDEKKMDLQEALQTASQMTLGGYKDWRVPNIKELYSLIDFNGKTGSHRRISRNGYPPDATPYINTDYFDFRYGNVSSGERYIDGQWLSTTKYVSTTMGGRPTLFGVNFADGRIKGYPMGYTPRGDKKKFYVRYVRGSHYGNNDFTDNGDGTVTDLATGLMWMKSDSQKPMSWKSALQYAEDFTYGGFDDWRLPNAKELQYIVDYTRSPDTSDSAAISPLFNCSEIKNEKGQKDFPFYWTSTSHMDGPSSRGVYIAFGRAIGMMHGQVMDVHGAGAQRSDPKIGRAQIGKGPQGDASRILNYVRLVRGGKISSQPMKKTGKNSYPNKIRVQKNSMTSGKMNRYNDAPSMHNQHMGGPQQHQGMSTPHMQREQNAKNGERFIRKLDKNGDKKVSLSEFDGPKHHFSRFDKNGDGYISLDEAPTGPPPKNRPGHP